MKKTVVKTSLAGKGHSSMQETIADISLRAVNMIVEGDDKVIDPTKIKLISQTGGRVEDSSLIQGLMLPKKRISSKMPKDISSGKILLIDGGLEQRGLKSDLKLNVTDTGVLESFAYFKMDIKSDSFSGLDIALGTNRYILAS